MTRTAIYSLQDNTLTEISDYEPPPDRPNPKFYSSSQQEMYQRHLEAWEIVMQSYNANKALYEKTLRTIPCHESARSLWKDGQRLEFEKDYRLVSAYVTDGESGSMQLVAMPNVPVKSEQNEDGLWREAIAVFTDCRLRKKSFAESINELHQKYIITKR